MKLKALSAVIVCCLAFSLLSCTPQKNTYPEETSFNVVFSDVVDLAVTKIKSRLLLAWGWKTTMTKNIPKI